MNTEVVYTKNARKNLRSLEKEEAYKIAVKIEFYSKQKTPLKYAKKLKPPFDDLCRFRIGSYRAIFQIDSKGNLMILIILAIKYRKDIY